VQPGDFLAELKEEIPQGDHVSAKFHRFMQKFYDIILGNPVNMNYRVQTNSIAWRCEV